MGASCPFSHPPQSGAPGGTSRGPFSGPKACPLVAAFQVTLSPEPPAPPPYGTPGPPPPTRVLTLRAEGQGWDWQASRPTDGWRGGLPPGMFNKSSAEQWGVCQRETRVGLGLGWAAGPAKGSFQRKQKALRPVQAQQRTASSSWCDFLRVSLLPFLPPPPLPFLRLRLQRCFLQAPLHTFPPSPARHRTRAATRRVCWRWLLASLPRGRSCMRGLGAWAGHPRPPPALAEPVPRLHPPGQPSRTEGLCRQPGPGMPVRSGVCLPNPAAAYPPQCHKPRKRWGRVEKPSFVVQV